MQDVNCNIPDPETLSILIREEFERLQ